MSSSVFNRRRSERFAELIAEASGERRHHRRTDLDAELTDLVGLTGRLGTAEYAPAASQEFRDGLRALLMAKIEREGVGTAADENQTAAARALVGRTQVVRQVPATGGNGRTRAAVLIGVTAGALALSGVSMASTDSLPGDPLYQVKRSSERAQLALAGSDESRGQLYLEFAYGRLIEASEAPDRAADALGDMDKHTIFGVRLLEGVAVERKDPAVLDAITTFVGKQRSLVEEIGRGLPTKMEGSVRESLALLIRVQERVGALGTAITRGCAIGPSDELGPSPAGNC